MTQLLTCERRWKENRLNNEGNTYLFESTNQVFSWDLGDRFTEHNLNQSSKSNNRTNHIRNAYEIMALICDLSFSIIIVGRRSQKNERSSKKNLRSWIKIFSRLFGGRVRKRGQR